MHLISPMGFGRGEIVMKRERDENKQGIEIMYDSEVRVWITKTSFIILRIQDFTTFTMVDLKDDTLSLPNSGSSP